MISVHTKSVQTVADLALSYAKAGLKVLPLHTPDPEMVTSYPCSCGIYQCPSAGKHPRTRNGLKDATTDAERIARWWKQWPTANVGVVPREDIAVIDVDPRNGGDVTLRELIAEHGPLPETLVARTGSGGLHIWLHHTGSARGKLGPGLDVKTATGYLVAPPSLHVCGGTYSWATKAKVAPAPTAWRLALRPAVASTGNRKPTDGVMHEGRALGIAYHVANAINGERNSLLFWAACRFWEDGADEEGWALLRRGAEICGLDERETEATIAKAARTVGVAA